MEYKEPIAPLMIEHRLIERMIAILNRGIQIMEKENKADLDLIEVAVDFFKTYADRTHHGKEEDILFEQLIEKEISDNHRKITNELIEEHKYAREKVKALLNAKQDYENQKDKSTDTIRDLIKDLTNFYPAHIKKEDQEFFMPIMKYFSKQEKNQMFKDFYNFDKEMIHEKYQKIIENLEK